eukprot:gene13450-12883_t
MLRSVLLCAAALPAAAAPPAGNLSVSQGQYTLPGFPCGNKTPGTVHIFYPADLNATYPIVSMMHGSGGSGIGALCSSIASLGIVVVAPTACGDWSTQQMHAVAGSQEY